MRVAADSIVFTRVVYSTLTAGSGEVALVVEGASGSARAAYGVLAEEKPLLQPAIAGGIAMMAGGGSGPLIDIQPSAGTFGTPSVPVSIQFCPTDGVLDPVTRTIKLGTVDVTGSFTYVDDWIECGKRSDGVVNISSPTSKLSATICHFEGACTTESAVYALGGSISLAPNPGNRLNRSECVTSSAGPAAAFQCGDLIVTHAMPGFRSMNRERSLNLIYNSGTARIQPVVMVDISVPSGSPVPDSVRINVSVNGISKGTYRFAQGALQAGGPPVRAAVRFLDNGLPTGVHDLDVTVTKVFHLGFPEVTAVSGDLIVVNRTASPYGAGWHIAGVSQVIAGQRNGALLLVHGDGSAAVYDSIAADTWRAPAGTFRDTIRHQQISNPGFETGGNWVAGYYYWSRSLDGTRVFYQGTTGRIAWVHTKAGDVVQYTHGGAGELTAVRVTPYSAGLTYSLAYSGGKLNTITDPAGRVLDATVSSGRLVDLRDPGFASGRKVVFTYSDNLLTSRKSRSGHTTEYTYHSGTSLVHEADLPATQAGSGTITFTPVQTRGLWASASTPLHASATATTQIDGPRSVADVATFWVNGQGAPTKVTGPGGETTVIERLDTVVPALPTRVSFNSGRTVFYAWNSTGTLAQVRDSASGIPVAVTRYGYGSSNNKARPDTIIDPVGLITRLAYGIDGQLTRVTAPNSHVTRFHHVKFSGPDGYPGQLESVEEESVLVYDSVAGTDALEDLVTAFTYDSIGNLTTQTTPRGAVTTYERDGMGRVRHVYDPEGHHNELVYDLVNRVTSSIHHEPGGPSYTTAQRHGPETLDTVIDPRQVLRRYSYDALGRITAEYDEAGAAETHELDLAGLVTSTTTRRNIVINSTYDAAGRRLTTAWDSSDIGGDSIVNVYDTMGWLLSSKNGRFKVVRTYYPNGLLESEVQSRADGSYPYTHQYWYDAAGRRTKYAIGSGANTDSIMYDYHLTTGDLRSIRVRWRNGVSDRVNFTFDRLGRRKQLVYAPQLNRRVTVDFRYDRDGNMVLLCSNASTNRFAFTRTISRELIDLDGNVGRISERDDGMCEPGVNQTTFAYDSRHQVTQSGLEEYEYDASGNRTLTRFRNHFGVVNREDTFVMPASSNRMSSWTLHHFSSSPLTTNLSYFDDGSRLREQPVGAPYPEREYFYDGLGRNTGFYYLDVHLQQYVFEQEVCLYGPLGRMRTGCEPGSVVLGHDGDNTVRTGHDSHPQAWTFVHGPGTDDPLMGFYSYQNKYIYFITDGAGRQYVVADTAGADYSSDQTYAQATTGGKYAGGITNANSFGADRYSNSKVPNLSFFRNRFYDQETGRWTQEDPIGVAGGVNLYAYVGNNPASFTDLFGLCPEDKGGDGETDRLDDCPEGSEGQKEYTAYMRCVQDLKQLALSLVGEVFKVGVVSYGVSSIRYMQEVRTVGASAALTFETSKHATQFAVNASLAPALTALQFGTEGGTQYDLGAFNGLYTLLKAAPIVGSGLELGEAINACVLDR